MPLFSNPSLQTPSNKGPDYSTLRRTSQYTQQERGICKDSISEPSCMLNAYMFEENGALVLRYLISQDAPRTSRDVSRLLGTPLNLG